MSIQKDDQGRRYVEVSVEVPGSPEEVWRAVATGPGYSAWFVPTTIEEREGGEMTFDLGPGMESKGRVTAWSPPHRLAFEESGWFGEAPPLATEVTVEAKAGGTCTVRMVHSLFTSRDDWDDQLESMEGGWPPFFQVLRLYLAEFAGLPCHSVRLSGSATGSEFEVFDHMKTLLGFTGGGTGEPLAFEATNGSPVHGADLGPGAYCGQRDLIFRVNELAPGIALVCTGDWGGRIVVAVQIYYYGLEAADAASGEKPAWQAWLDRHFPDQLRAG